MRFPPLSRSATALAAVLAFAAWPAAHAQSLKELYDAARAYDATYLAALKLAESTKYKVEQSEALNRPSASLTASATGTRIDPPNNTIASVSLSIIAVSGARTRWVVGLIGGAVVSVLLAIQLGLLKEYQVQRLTSFINPSADVSSAAYNANQARIAIGGGGWFGYGLFNGPQTQGKFVPVNESDFIFTVVGEELGFIGVAVLILLLAIVLWRAVTIAYRADDLYGRLVATGVVAWLAFQLFENIGMSLGIMPITGIPLPMVSAGGTSMMATWIGVGLLQNVRLHAVRAGS